MRAGNGPDVETAVENLVGLRQILPSQFYDATGSRGLSAEQRLMLALLADAINVYQKGVLSGVPRKRLLYLDAERWIMARQTGTHAFTFETVCEALGINPALLRRKLIDWKHSVSRACTSRAVPHLRLKSTPRGRRPSQARHREQKGGRQAV